MISPGSFVLFHSIGPSFLDADDDELAEYESFCNSRAYPSDVGFNDHFDIENHWKKDFYFEDWNLQTKRSPSC